jgi:hypothetical protein
MSPPLHLKNISVPSGQIPRLRFRQNNCSSNPERLPEVSPLSSFNKLLKFDFAKMTDLAIDKGVA